MYTCNKLYRYGLLDLLIKLTDYYHTATIYLSKQTKIGIITA